MARRISFKTNDMRVEKQADLPQVVSSRVEVYCLCCKDVVLAQMECHLAQKHGTVELLITSGTSMHIKNILCWRNAHLLSQCSIFPAVGTLLLHVEMIRYAGDFPDFCLRLSL